MAVRKEARVYCDLCQRRCRLAGDDEADALRRACRTGWRSVVLHRRAGISGECCPSCVGGRTDGELRERLVEAGRKWEAANNDKR